MIKKVIRREWKGVAYSLSLRRKDSMVSVWNNTYMESNCGYLFALIACFQKNTIF